MPESDETSGKAGDPAPRDPAPKDPARARFYFIAAHRVIGAVLIALGILAMRGALDWGEGVGKVLAIVGLIDFFVIPLMLARLWRSIPK